MKTIGSIKEDLKIEKRISITPETVKKFTTLGFSVNLEKSYVEHLGINDEEYKKNGANISFSKEEVFQSSNIILKVNNLSLDEINLIKDKSILIGQFDSNLDKSKIKKNISIFSLNLLPRITRAQSMDVLSSQANLAGYKAVLESFSKSSISTIMNFAPKLSTCSLVAILTSVAETTAPNLLAVAIACSPATPTPKTITLAGFTLPAAVIIIGKAFLNCSAASITLL